MADYPEKAFYGTAQTCIDTASNISSGNFSGSPAATFDNTSDSAVPYARWAVCTAVFPDWSAAPAAGATIDVYGVLQDVDSTSDDTDAPSGTTVGGAKFFGSFILAAADALQRRTIVIDVLGVQKVNFYWKNATAVTMTNNGGTNGTMKVTPLAYGITTV